MSQVETLETFYRNKFTWIPESLTQDWGHFNVFKLDPYIGAGAKPVPYRRRDFYKITLVRGQGKIFFADKVIEVKERAIVFSNPLIPYKWEHTDFINSGYFCIFNDDFFHLFGQLNRYSMYQPQGIPVIELGEDSYQTFVGLFEKMLIEIDSEYIHKYDMLRNIAMELMHTALKLEPANISQYAPGNANQKISMLFLELLERQFPIEGSHAQIKLKSASDFATQLAIHVNHLNRAIKETTQKTTSQVIAERILQEAKLMLKFGDWSITEIAEALGFHEVSYFNHFFKKLANATPKTFRNR